MKRAGIGPWIAFLFGALMLPARRFRRQLLLLLVVSLLPLQNYRDSLALLGAGVHPRRSLSACVRTVQAAGAAPSGLRVDEPVEAISHSIVYYFEPIRPWVRGNADIGTPALIREPIRVDGHSAALGEGMAVTLPPPYAACAAGTDRR